MVRNCRLKIECWISGYRETAERIITMKLGYLEFVEVLRKTAFKCFAFTGTANIFLKRKP